MEIVIDISYGPQLYVPSGENRKHRISPHNSYFHVHKHVNRQHGTSHDLNFPQSQTTNYKVRTGTSTESSKFGLLAPGRMVAATTNPLVGEKTNPSAKSVRWGNESPTYSSSEKKISGASSRGAWWRGAASSRGARWRGALARWAAGETQDEGRGSQ